MATNSQAINTLTEAAWEIKRLRRDNELMAARLGVFDAMVAIFQTSPSRCDQGMSPDIVYGLDQLAKKMESELTPCTKAASPPIEK